MLYAVAWEWDHAYTYALKGITVRKRADVVLILLDFSRQHETEALLRGRDQRQAREAAQRLGEHLGPTRRYRIPYLRSLATLTAWEGHTEQSIHHLREADKLAAHMGLPGARWQIQAALRALYEEAGNPAQARTAVGAA